MKKIFLSFLFILSGLLTAQIKVKDLPTTTTTATGDFLIKDKAAGTPGSTQKITLGNVFNWAITTYSLQTSSPISGLTTNKYTKATSATAIGDALLSDDGTNIIVPSGKKITGATTSAIQLDFGTTGSPYFQITPDAGGYATSAYYQDVDGISLSWNGTNDGSIFIDDSRTTMVKTSLGKKWGLSVAKNAFYDGIKGGIYIADNSTASFTEPGFDQAAAVSINSKSSTINSGVKNSVILGGTSLTASADNTAYMQNANFSGTIGAGTWNGSVINSTYGGTGINNAGRTLTLNSNNAAFTFGGAYTLTVPATGTATLGTGTTNAITKWTGTNTVGASSVVSDDGTNLILGSNKYISSADGASGIIEFGTNSNAKIQYESGGDANYLNFTANAFDLLSFSGLTQVGLTGNSSSNEVLLRAGTINLLGDVSIDDGNQAVGRVFTCTNAITGAGTWQALSSGGTVTSIATGNGITGGTITTTGTLGLSGATGDIGSFSGTDTYSPISAVAAGSYLRSAGTSTLPVWSTLKLPNSATANYIPYATSTNTLGESANLTFDGTSMTVGGSALVSSTDVARFHRNQNGGTVFYLTNATSGTAARSEYYSSADNGSTALFMGMNSAGYTTSGMRVAGASTIGTTSSVGFNIGTSTNVPMSFWTNNTERVRLLSTGEMVIGASTLLGTELLSVQKNQNAITQFAVSNSTAGTAARAGFTCYTSGGVGITLGAQSSSFTTSGMLVQNTATIHSTQTGGLNIGTIGGAYQISFWVNSAKKAEIDANANVILNSSGSALATNATNGFTYIPTCAGTPTGVPSTLPTGALPIIIDSTNNKMYIYSGGAWVALN